MVIQRATFETDLVEVYIDRVDDHEIIGGQYHVHVFETKPERSIVDSLIFKTYKEALDYVNETILENLVTKGV